MKDKPDKGEPEPTPFQKFADMTRKILAVPKADVDRAAKRKAAERKKSGR